SFLIALTQAPANNPPGGLTGGGLDDRFDFQMTSGELTNGSGIDYRSGTYHTFGNNGSVPLNGDINIPSSTALPGLSNRVTILNLLTTVTDHLPVVADFRIPSSTPTTTALVSSLNPSSVGQSVTFTATVTPSAATGTVSFRDNGVEIGTGTLSSGQATFSTSTLTVATHPMTAVYLGDATYDTSTSGTVNQVVNPIVGSFQFSAATYSAPEGDSGTSTVTITVSRTGGTAAGSVDYATSDGTATAGSDYVAASGTLDFPANDTSKTFTVTVNGDTPFEPDETVNLTLSNPTNGGAVGTPGSAVLTIANDDLPPTLQVQSFTPSGGGFRVKF